MHALWLKHQSEYLFLVQQFPRSRIQNHHAGRPLSQAPVQQLSWTAVCGPSGAHAFTHPGELTQLYEPLFRSRLSRSGWPGEVAGDTPYLSPLCPRPMALRHTISLKRLDPLLLEIATAPLSQSCRSSARPISDSRHERACDLCISVMRHFSRSWRRIHRASTSMARLGGKTTSARA